MEENQYAPPFEGDFEKQIKEYRVRAAKRSFSRCLLAATIYLLIATAVIYAAQFIVILAFGNDRGLEIVEGKYFIWIMQVMAMYVIAFPIFYLIVRKLPTAKRESSGISLEEMVMLFFIAEGAMILGAIISETVVSALSGLLGYEIGNATSDMIMDTPVWIVIIVAVILGPIFEELMFRKIFIDRMGVYGDRLAILTSAVAFGVFHGNLSQILYATSVGLIFGYVYVKTGNVKYSILLHIIINFVGTVPALLVSDSVERIEAITDETVINAQNVFSYYTDIMNVGGVALIQYVFAFIGVGFFIYLITKRKIKIPSSCEVKLPEGSTGKVVFATTGAICFMIMCALEIVLSLLPV